jgi:alanyl-tRNA synthetase
MLFGTRVAETILASVHVRAHQQAGHMDASDLIKALQNTLRGGGRPHMGQGHVSLLRPTFPFRQRLHPQ